MSPRHPATRRQRGFTLLELIVTVTVAAIIAALALPNLREFVQNNARATRLNSLVTAINFARNDAVSQRRTTTLCASTDNATCSGANQFQTGYVVISGGALLRVFQPGGADAFTLVGFTAAAAPLSQVDFDPTGRASGVANARFRYCDSRGTPRARAIVLSATGGPRMTRDTNGDGIDDINGVNLACP